MGKKLTIRSRAVAAFISMKANADFETKKEGFVFESSDGVRVASKSFREWEREFSRHEMSTFNAMLKSMGDEQRQLT